LVEVVLDVLASIGEPPDRYPLAGADVIIRRALLHRFPCAVWFGRERHDVAVVYAISQAKRRPGYWRVRARQA
jgi:hypothetical protein